MMCMDRLHQLPLTLMSGLWLALPTSALAVGTSAGLDINSTASVSYSIGGSNGNATSNTATFRVNEILDVTVSWQDATNRIVSSPATNQVLSFLLSNTGNGNDSYTLNVANNLAGDQFDPSLVDIYLDADANDLFDPAVDTLYVTGTNDPLLAADAALTIFVRNNIPAGLNGGDLGNSRLSATSITGSGAPGTVLNGAGDNTTAAVIGTTGGSSSASGSYEINGPTQCCS